MDATLHYGIGVVYTAASIVVGVGGAHFRGLSLGSKMVFWIPTLSWILIWECCVRVLVVGLEPIEEILEEGL